jgi:hypothetical protein
VQRGVVQSLCGKKAVRKVKGIGYCEEHAREVEKMYRKERR